jgi:hypothetical protein
MASEETSLKNVSDESLTDELIDRLKLEGEDADTFRRKVLTSLGYEAKPVYIKPAKKETAKKKSSFWGSTDDDDDDDMDLED